MIGLGVIITVEGTTNFDALKAQFLLRWGGFVLPEYEKVRKVNYKDLVADLNARLRGQTLSDEGDRSGLILEALARIHVRSFLNEQRTYFQRLWSSLGNTHFDIEVDNFYFELPGNNSANPPQLMEIDNLIYKDNGDGTIDILGIAESKVGKGKTKNLIEQINNNEARIRSQLPIGSGNTTYLAKDITFKLGPSRKPVRIRNIVPEKDFLRYAVREPNTTPLNSTKNIEEWSNAKVIPLKIPECPKLFNGLMNAYFSGNLDRVISNCTKEDYSLNQNNPIHVEIMKYFEKTLGIAL